jgi:SAM-dependent methyltransferase
MTELKDVLKSVSRAEGRYRRRKVDRTTHEHDDMLDRRNPNTRAHYFEVGQGALSLVLRAMILCQKPTVENVLVLPCGYGRELRHFVNAFPKADYTACEIEDAKMEYCATQFGARAVPSSVDFDTLTFDRSFDLIWSGSLLTHLPEHRYRSALSLFSRVLAPGGIALVTLQGRNTPHFQEVEFEYMDQEGMVDAVKTFTETGWAFAPYPGEVDYGITFALPSVVHTYLEQDPTVSCRGYIERGWDDHQDVLIFQKEPIGHRWTSLGRLPVEPPLM